MKHFSYYIFDFGKLHIEALLKQTMRFLLCAFSKVFLHICFIFLLVTPILASVMGDFFGKSAGTVDNGQSLVETIWDDFDLGTWREDAFNEFEKSASNDNFSSLLLLYAKGSKKASVYEAQFNIPLNDIFEVDLRFASRERQFSVRRRESYYSSYSYFDYSNWYHGWVLRTVYYRYSYYYYDDFTMDNNSGDLSFVFKPLGKGFISPYIATGIRYEDYSKYHDNCDNLGLVIRGGVLLNCSPVNIRCEYIGGEHVSELVGDVAIGMSGSLSLHLYVNSFEFKDVFDGYHIQDTDAVIAYGGGLELCF